MQAASNDHDAMHSYCEHIPDTPTQQPTCRAKKKQSTSLLQRLPKLRSPISPQSERAFCSSMYRRRSVCPPPVSMGSDCSSYPTCSSIYGWPAVAALNQEICFISEELPSPFPVHSKPAIISPYQVSSDASVNHQPHHGPGHQQAIYLFSSPNTLIPKDHYWKKTTTKVNCVICRDDVEEGKLLPCGHRSFHINCINKWLWRRDTCPVCQERVFRKKRHLDRSPNYCLV